MRVSLLLFLIAIAVAPASFGQTFVAIPNRSGLTFGPNRILYVGTEHGFVARYDLVRDRFLPSWGAGRTLTDIDVSPGGDALFVGESEIEHSPRMGFVRRLDLADGAVTPFAFPLDDGEDGTADLAVTSNGSVFFSTEFRGSGQVVLRELDPATGSSVVRRWINQSTRIDRSSDGATLFLVEPNNSAGPIFLYDATTDAFIASAQLNAPLWYVPTAIDAAGQRVAVLGDCGVRILDRDFAPLSTLCAPSLNGIAFDPAAVDRLYWIEGDTGDLVTMDLDTGTEVARIPTGENETLFEIATSDDGADLAVSANDGIRLFALRPPTDTDGDGVGDDADRCILDPDPGQQDDDQDGVGDACDSCPSVANAAQDDIDADDLGDACDPFPALDLRIAVEAPAAGIVGDAARVAFRLETPSHVPVTTPGVRATVSVDRGARFAHRAHAGLLLAGGVTGQALVEFVDGRVEIDILSPATPARVRFALRDGPERGLRLTGPTPNGFEAGRQGFVGTDGAWGRLKPIQSSGPQGAATGEWAWGALVKYNAVLPAPAELTSPVFSISSDGNPSFDFRSYLDVSSPFDEAQLAISADAGTSWMPLASFMRHARPRTYQTYSFDLSAFRGRDVRLRWTFDSARRPTERGWYVDDVTIRGAAPALDFLDPEADPDGDTQTNESELTNGTDPFHPDTDDDATRDDTDNCPLLPNPSQADRVYAGGTGDACSDIDGDGVVDEEDDCPFAANANQVDSDGDSLGDVCDPHPSVALRVRIVVPETADANEAVVATYQLESRDGAPLTSIQGVRITATIDGPGLFGAATAGDLLDGAGTQRATIDLVDGLAKLEVHATGDGVVTLSGEDSHANGVAILGTVREDFEQDDGGFEAGGPAWQYGLPTAGPSAAFSGARAWAAGLTGAYPHGADTSLVSRVIPLSATPGARLEFREWHGIESRDRLLLELSSDGGSTWQNLSSFSNFGGTPSTQYVLRSYDLSALAGSDLRVRFRLQSDATVSGAGFFLDDFTVRDVETSIRFVPEPATAAQAGAAMLAAALLARRRRRRSCSRIDRRVF